MATAASLSFGGAALLGVATLASLFKVGAGRDLVVLAGLAPAFVCALGGWVANSAALLASIRSITCLPSITAPPLQVKSLEKKEAQLTGAA